MYPKAPAAAAIYVTLVFVVLVAFTLVFCTVDLRSSTFRLLYPPSLPPTAPFPCASPLRVYMYDLPRRFNVGMLHSKSVNDSPVTAVDLPPWPSNSGLRRQHSVEYWMTASLLYTDREGGGGGEFVRVSDPDDADVYFVPFFSSLSFNTHGHHMTDPDTEIDRQLQIDLLEFLRNSKYWQRSGGRDHVIPMSHPNAFRFLREQVNASILIVVDFGRYPRALSNLKKDVVSPYVHVVDTFLDDYATDPYGSRPLLLFFRGGMKRKAEGIVRAKLEKILDGYDDVQYVQSTATTESIKMATQGMRSSRFCLHPAGDTPSSCRLFDAIVSHCVPVIVSDQIELPYEDEINYSRFSIFFSVKEALQPGYMVDKLRVFPRERWVEMWSILKNISHHYEFQYPPKKGDAVDMLWRQVKHKLPSITLDVHRNQRLKIPDWWRRKR